MSGSRPVRDEEGEIPAEGACLGDLEALLEERIAEANAVESVLARMLEEAGPETTLERVFEDLLGVESPPPA